jgi:hypothetical protein
MKRIALLGFLLIGLPVLFTACNKDEYCGGYVGKLYLYTCSKIENSILREDTIKYIENDTVSDDTIRFMVKFTTSSYGKTEIKERYNPYSTMASCGDMALPANKINSGAFILKSNGQLIHLDSISSRAILKTADRPNFPKFYNLPADNWRLWSDLRSGAVLDNLIFYLPTPHFLKNMTFLSQLIKEKGDTLKAVGPKVFCR